jgi:hypothetical protein
MTDARSTDRLRGAGTAIVVSAAVVAGCAQTQPVTAPPPTTTLTQQVSTTLTDEALDLAVRAGSYRTDQRLLFQAEKELTQRCMASRGWQYLAGPSGPAELEDDMWRPDLDLRRRLGYGFAATGPADGGGLPTYLPPASRDAYRQALTGAETQRATLHLFTGPTFTFGTTGCIAQSRVRLYGDVIDAARATYVPQEVYNAIYRQVTDDDATQAAVDRWARCMTHRDHMYRSPAEARAAVSRTYDSTGPSAASRQFEIQVAVADGECALAAGLPEVVDQVGRGHVRELAPQLRQDLNLATELRANALLQARDVLR